MSKNLHDVRSKRAIRSAVMSLALLFLVAAGGAARAQQRVVEAFTPFQVIGNIYYVGDTRNAIYLITTPEGHILLDTGYPETAPIVRDGVQQLGFEMRDIKIMISGHAHSDHVGGHALVKEMTGARILASELDAPVIESGGRSGRFRGPSANPWPPTKVDQVIRDGEQVTLGGVTLTAHFTPGHTQGNTAWTMGVEDGGRRLNVAFLPSLGVNNNVHLVNYPNYPNIVEDYTRSFQVAKGLSCEVFLGPHGSFFNLEEKYARLQDGAQQNPFIDPAGCRRYIEEREANFQKQLQEERQTRR